MSTWCNQWIRQLLRELERPIVSSSLTYELRNTAQNSNCKVVKKRTLTLTLFTSPQSDPELLTDTKRDSSTPLYTMVISSNFYGPFLHTEKQLKDIELFCCDDENNSCVLGTDTTIKSCNMWVIETFFHNNRLLSSRLRKNHVHLGPVMMYFIKEEQKSRRFWFELILANLQLVNLKKVGVHMEAAIANVFQSVIYKLLQLHCTCLLQQRHKKTFDSCQLKSSDGF